MSVSVNDSVEKAEMVTAFEKMVAGDKYFNGYVTMRFADGRVPHRTYVDLTMELAYRSFEYATKKVSA